MVMTRDPVITEIRVAIWDTFPSMFIVELVLASTTVNVQFVGAVQFVGIVRMVPFGNVQVCVATVSLLRMVLLVWIGTVVLDSV